MFWFVCDVEQFFYNIYSAKKGFKRVINVGIGLKLIRSDRTDLV